MKLYENRRYIHFMIMIMIMIKVSNGSEDPKYSKFNLPSTTSIISWCGWCRVSDGLELSKVQLLVQTGPDNVS